MHGCTLSHSGQFFLFFLVRMQSIFFSSDVADWRARIARFAPIVRARAHDEQPRACQRAAARTNCSGRPTLRLTSGPSTRLASLSRSSAPSGVEPSPVCRRLTLRRGQSSLRAGLAAGSQRSRATARRLHRHHAQSSRRGSSPSSWTQSVPCLPHHHRLAHLTLGGTISTLSDRRAGGRSRRRASRAMASHSSRSAPPAPPWRTAPGRSLQSASA